MNPFINWLSQVANITRFGIQTIPDRAGPSFAAAFGIAGVVAVLVGVLSIAQGFRRAVTVSGSPANAVVLRSGADTEMTSSLTGEEARIISDAPAIERNAGHPIVSSELFVVIALPKRTTGTDANVPLRGVQTPAFEVRRDFKIIAGRQFEPGRNELMAGAGIAGEIAGLDLGKSLKIGRNNWTVVGIFTCGGGIAESELWCDAAVLQPAYQRGNTYQGVYARLTSPDAFEQFKDSLTSDPRLHVNVRRETDFYSEQSTMFTTVITVLGTLISALMATGAVFGALNTMYSAVAARTREIATLRALGFGSSPILISVLLESMILALAGGAIGGAVAYFAFDGFRTATMNWQTFSQVAFAFDVTPSLLIQGTLYATLIGVVGGLFPAIRAARLPIAAALRDL